MKDNNQTERLDSATCARLAKLAARPVDTSSLERRLEAALRESVMQAPAKAAPLVWQRWWRPLTSAAAAIVLAVTIGWLVLDAGTSPAMAAPAEMAQIHHDVVNGLSPHLRVSSVEQANQLLADQSNGIVSIPELPGMMMSCCLQQYADTTLTCALIDRDGQLISVAIADGAKLHSPHGETITRKGRRYTAHTANGINMVMAHRGDRWMCVMGDATTEQLLQVAEAIAF